MGVAVTSTNQGTWRGHRLATLCAVVTCANAPGCKRHDPEPGPPFSGDLRSDGTRVTLVAAAGETLGLRVTAGPASLKIFDATVQPFAVEPAVVTRPSTAMYGGSRGAGAYPDALGPGAASYFEITATRPGVHAGELVVGARRFPVELTIAPVQLALPMSVWAYYDPRELGGTVDEPSEAERACITLFRMYGVLLSPDLPPSAWPARRDLLAEFPFVPATIPDGADSVRAWIAATAGTGKVPFAVPIDEPRTDQARAKVRALAAQVRAAGGGPGRFLFAVTDAPRPEYGDLVDLYIPLTARISDRFPRWTYNGAPPRAGSMVVDAEPPGPRTWGWIAWRWNIPVWYVWDALYWHDRHNKRGALDAKLDAVSFDDGDDHGNLDGVLAMPGCRPTLRLAALRRGLEDRALLELAAKCDPAATARLAEQMVPRALGDADDAVAWPTDDATWETARRRLIELAGCNH